ncbi:hypothetical protein HY68_35955 [Streptomyces sp. AcH 505]|nr:hypothetical protein HY68_35955 [Streptomyces sp. AcH 505]
MGALVGAAAVGAVWFGTSRGAPAAGTEVHAVAKPAAKATPSAKPNTFTLTGEFDLVDGAVADGTGGCEGTGGYDDITMGTSVTVYDAAGTVIAASSLILSTFDEDTGTCAFDVSIDAVPTGEDFYQVEISHRGKVQLSAEEAQNGQFASSLG